MKTGETKRPELKLSERLRAVASMVTEGNVVCDVGCDHGFVPVYLVKNGISPRVIAMDINEGPLTAAGKHIATYFLTDYIETRLSDGLAALMPGEADTVICAGMGGRLVIRILEEGREKLAGVKELVLQPQTELPSVREYLRERGYFLADEDIVLEDGKYYPMMRACPQALREGAGERCGQEGKASREQLLERQRMEDKYGPVLLGRKHPTLRAYLQREIDICGQIMRNLRENGNGRETRQREIAERMEDARRALSCLENG